MLGKQLGNWKIESVLGRGGMGEVYLARHQFVEARFAAVKHPNSECLADPKFRDRFLREIRALAAFNHPRILGFIDVFQEGNQLYLLGEYAPGGSLAERLARAPERRLPLEQALDWLDQALEGLVEAHKHGILHRDIKPANLLLDARDQIKVADFGLALIQDETRRATSATLGTPCYMSPEQIERPLELDQRSDLYAMGCLMYELLTGSPPFDRGESFAIAFAHVNQPPLPPRRLVPELDPRLEQVVLQALEKRPERRFADGESFRAALREARKPAQVRSVAKPTAPAARSRQLWGAGLALLALILLYGLWRGPFSAPDRPLVGEEQANLEGKLDPTPAETKIEPPRESIPVKPDPKPAEAESGAEVKKTAALSVDEPALKKPEPKKPAAEEARPEVPKEVPKPRTFPEVREATATQPEAQRQPRAGERLLVRIKGEDFAFRWCPPGNFMMGSPTGEKDRDSDETPHEVRLTRGVWIQETELTQRQWEAVMGAGSNPSSFKGADRPVEMVSWEDAQRYCRKLKELTGVDYRLPTEAEWEYACRAGTTTPFHYGARLDATMANFNGNYPYGGASKGEYRQQTTAVRSFTANAWGLYDLHGNVYEWCSDWYGAYPEKTIENPIGPAQGTSAGRVLRGGCCRSANRGGNGPGYRVRLNGFRLATSSSGK